MDRLISMILRRVLREAARKVSAPEKSAARGTGAPPTLDTRRQMQMARKLGKMVGRL